MLTYSKLKILIAEDDMIYYHIMSTIIVENFADATLYHYNNGADAFFHAKAIIPDIIITDWDMPSIDGLELTVRIKSTSELAHIPVLMYTAKNTNIENLQLAFSKGVSDYIIKPFNKIEFIARIRAQIAISRLYQTIISQKEELANEKIRAEELLHNVLPDKVADELIKNKVYEPRIFDDVTVYLSDIVGFTGISKKITQKELFSELNTLFTAFDKIMKRHKCERIKTMGDAYIAVSGMHNEDKDHALNIINAGHEIISFLHERNQRTKIQWEIRTAIHTGSVIGGIVGNSKFIYDIFGDTMNQVSRMEKCGRPMEILISSNTLLKMNVKADIKDKITINAKGIGEFLAFFLSEKSAVTV